jgi:hypothetical protein
MKSSRQPFVQTNMFTRRAVLVLLVTTLLDPGAPAGAHHSFAMFDKSKFATLKGAVVKLEWSNPHIYLYLATPDGQAGGTAQYTFEGSSPNELNRWGWKINTIKVGDAVTVDYFPLRDGRPGGLIYSVTTSSGTVLKAN